MKHIFTITFVFLSTFLYSQNGADLDNTFNNSSLTPLSRVVSVNNQYLLVANDGTDNILVRLNSDGTIDSSFNFSGSFNSVSGSYRSIELQNDGKIITGGPQFNNNSKTINRFNSDGTLDTSFSFSQNLSQINAIKIQNDGKILYGADNHRNFGRLNTDGSEDTSFITGSNISHSNLSFVSVEAIEIDNNNKILVGGTYNRYNGNVSNGLTRLNMDGTIDTSLNIGSGFNYDWVIVKDIAVQNDDKIVVGGNFTSFDGAFVRRLVRLNNDGSRDMTFTSYVDNQINDISIQQDGKILIGGYFTTINGNTTKNRLCRFNADGSIDASFDILTGFDNFINTLDLDDDNKLIVTGRFNAYQGTTSNKLIRLIGSSTLSTNEVFQDNVKIFPNPVGEELNVTVNSFDYEIYNLVGTRIMKGSISTSNSINVNSLNQGLYFIRLDTRDFGNQVIKFLKR